VGFGIGIEGMTAAPAAPAEAETGPPSWGFFSFEAAPDVNINEAFAPPAFTFTEPSYEAPPFPDVNINEAFEFAQPPSFFAKPSLTQPISVTESNLALAKFAIDALNAVWGLFGLALGVLGFAPTPAAPAARGTSLGLGLGEKGLGLFGVKTSEKGWLSEAIVSVFAPQTVAALQSQKAQTAPAPAPAVAVSPAPVSSQSYSPKGTPISMTPGTPVPYSMESSVFAIPVTPEAAMPLSKPYPSLSTSLFGIPSAPKKEERGLMIFPTSAKGIEPEGSSLLKKQDVSGAGPFKKQEPVFNTTSLLFLLGMGAVGIVLRKGR
jgi:hypothetical protein